MIWIIIAGIVFVIAMVTAVWRVKSYVDSDEGETLNPIPFVPLPIKTPQTQEEIEEVNRLHLLELEARRAKHIKDSVHTHTFSRAEDDGWNFTSAPDTGEIQIPTVGLIPAAPPVVVLPIESEWTKK